MLQLVEQLHDIVNKRNLKLAPENVFMLLTVKRLGHEFGFDRTKTIQSKIAAILESPSPTTKIELMRFIGSMIFHSIFIDELHVNMKPLYVSLQDIN